MVKRKNKNDSTLFTLKWTRGHQTRVTKKLLGRVGIVLLSTFFVLAIGFGSGAFRFAAGVARCGGLPVMVTSIMSKTATAPGDSGYKISSFASYEFCTIAEAQADGVGLPVNSDEYKARAEAQRLEREEAQRFSKDKVTYTVYIPEIDGYSYSGIRLSEIQSVNHTFYSVKKNGTITGNIRLVPADNDYAICLPEENTAKNYCEVIGYDSSHREIKRSYRKGLKGWNSNSTGIVIGQTAIIYSGEDDDAEVVRVLSAMREYKD